MSQTIVCQSCSSRIRVKDRLQGKKIQCPKCSCSIQVPELEERVEENPELDSQVGHDESDLDWEELDLSSYSDEPAQTDWQRPDDEVETYSEHPIPKKRKDTQRSHRQNRRTSDGGNLGTVLKRIGIILMTIVGFFVASNATKYLLKSSSSDDQRESEIAEIASELSDVPIRKSTHPEDWKTFPHPSGMASAAFPGNPEIAFDKSKSRLPAFVARTEECYVELSVIPLDLAALESMLTGKITPPQLAV